ncbi:MAG: pentapeptide repeat-containing protein, partial [Acidobacteria bacterium]|nr:pentapeptide repeat-containing protein [Acidobacteriota bacterium]
SVFGQRAVPRHPVGGRGPVPGMQAAVDYVKLYAAYDAATRIVVSAALSGLLCLVVFVYSSSFSATPGSGGSLWLLAAIVSVPTLVAGMSFWIVRLQNGDRGTGIRKAEINARRVARLYDGLDDSVQLLAADDPTVQMGALYALEASAFDSEAHAEAHARIVISTIEGMIRKSVPNIKADGSWAETAIPAPQPHVQAGLIMLGTLSRSVPAGIRFHLDGLDLRGYNLEDLDLSAANLGRCNLSRCAVSNTKLDGADLRDACLSEVVGDNASFRRALLERTTLRGSFLPGSDFTGALLMNADLSCTVLVKATFDRSIAAGCDLERADLTGATFLNMRGRNKFVKNTLDV